MLGIRKAVETLHVHAEDRRLRQSLSWPNLVAPLAILGCLYLFARLKPQTMRVFFGWNAAGLLLYLLYRRSRSRAQPKVL